MGSDVLVVGAGPTGLMLANQLARRGVKPLIIDRHSGPAQQTRAIGVQARTMEIYAWMGLMTKRWRAAPVAGGANLWANGEWKARIPVGDIGQDLSPYPVHPDARPGRERAHHGGKARRARRADPMEHRAHRIRAEGRSRRGADQAARRQRPHRHGRVGRGLRRVAQRGARALPHRLSWRAIRAHVLRRRHGSDRLDAAGRAQRLSVARRLPPVLSDARQGPLARDRHPARGTARTRRT